MNTRSTQLSVDGEHFELTIEHLPPADGTHKYEGIEIKHQGIELFKIEGVHPDVGWAVDFIGPPVWAFNKSPECKAIQDKMLFNSALALRNETGYCPSLKEAYAQALALIAKAVRDRREELRTRPCLLYTSPSPRDS